MTDTDCDTGLCQAIGTGSAVCRRKCSSTCNTGEICEELGDDRFGCVADKGGLCTACVSDSDCPYPADKCLVLDGTHTSAAETARTTRRARPATSA